MTPSLIEQQKVSSPSIKGFLLKSITTIPILDSSRPPYDTYLYEIDIEINHGNKQQHCICMTVHVSESEMQNLKKMIDMVPYNLLPPTQDQLKSKKLTPEQAWPHVKALYPTVAYIKPNKAWEGVTTEFQVGGSARGPVKTLAEFAIEWPEGMKQWPPKPQKYRTPTNEDIGKIVQVRNDERDTWLDRELAGILPSGMMYMFVCKGDANPNMPYYWRYARIECTDE